MIIDESLLLENGAVYEDYPAKEFIYEMGGIPYYYFQIVKGTVELNNYHEDGKEFTLNILSEGQSFGESLLFGNKNYPMNAVAKTDCRILKLPKSNFLSMLSTNTELMFTIFRYLSDRLFYKYVMLFNNSAIDPMSKIKSLMDYYKGSSLKQTPYSYPVPLTRQQIANLTGLRVETVIRTIKKMAEDNVLRLDGRTILY
ncbi:CRP-like cAMP-binding protein [Chryseobacterium bernardetii]|jgi:CRP-like cAMP-binding protein|uniref:CRP-like cAMP-binding protein n=1 Tax=Chryseobacterium bernardetii TaxID=1241978 RepID=A0ACC6IUJ9_9FLAO|nr:MULTISPECIES: Crp/Fnr family transcriptional regulator [Chryseobacterium]MBP1164602.1 CRP-like cAMP-binding protein [Chryseobacterium sp. PvR013]MDR6370912.1 CRP-like cAMP-binding protein [Chryseobacterium vietnamense]MDR6441342.1 CRP-like cAMP-binding protein [Chryseobacterium bernardetii]